VQPVVAPTGTVTRVEAEVLVDGLRSLVSEMRGLVQVLRDQVSRPQSEYKPAKGFSVVYPRLGSRDFRIEIER